MKSLRLVNIRSFADSQAVAIAPLTLLVGQNSSGKSTFARFFPLLRQTTEVLAREPLLWLGRFVDFGSAEEVVSKVSNGEAFGADFEYVIDRGIISLHRRRINLYGKPMQNSLIPILASVRYLQPFGAKQGYRFSLSFLGNEISIEILDSAVVQLKINRVDCTALTQARLFANTWTSCFPNLIYRDDASHEPDAFFRQIFAYARENTHGKSQTERVEQLTRALIYAPLDGMLKAVKNPYAGDTIWQKTTAGWHEATPDFLQLKNWIIGARIVELIQSAGAAFANQCSRIRYITPIRASAERYYRRQGLALGEVDPQGQNVAMFLHNMPSSEKQKFFLWMADLFGYYVDTVSSVGHISMVMRAPDLERDKLSFNLADTGFGFSQMIPVLIQIWNIMNTKVSSRGGTVPLSTTIIAIEQPELHLHPRMQSRLADLFIQAIASARQSGIDLRIVVETHSEQIINRVGKRVASGQLQPADVSLVIFDKPGFANPTRVTSTSYDDEGLVNNWPYGFFDSDDK